MSQQASTIPLIQTGYRKKLRRGLSHPIGAEAISRALTGCPKFDELWIAFDDKPEPLHLVPKGCEGFSSAFSVSAYGWYLVVPAVPSELRHTVGQLLELAGLPGVREWLLRPRPETWYSGVKWLEVGYAVEPARVCFIELESRKRKVKLIASTIREVPSVRPAIRVNRAASVNPGFASDCLKG